MTELTLEELAELERLHGLSEEVGGIAHATPALLAMARDLIRIRSALEFLHALNFDGHGWHPERIVELARRQGQPDPLSPPATPVAELKGGEG